MRSPLRVLCVTGDLRRDLFRHLTGHAPSYFAERMPGTLTSRITATIQRRFHLTKHVGVERHAALHGDGHRHCFRRDGERAHGGCVDGGPVVQPDAEENWAHR